MSNESDGGAEKIHEIVIVKRRSDHDDDEHHGGVWKVAFADFMTAMMAFFLVLWIVNSTTKETRNSLARYFNPIRLSDTTPARRGLKDPKEDQFDAQGVDVREKGRSQKDAKKQPKDGAAMAVDAGGAASAGSDPAARANAGGNGGESGFEDPFIVPSNSGRDLNNHSDGKRDGKSVNQVVSVGSGSELERTARALMSEIRKRLGDESFAELGEALTVAPADEGVLVSLTDKSNFGMFAVGSAAPEPRMIEALGAIAMILGRHDGAIVIRGHTDSRPYRGGESDNWRLSSMRAWSAYQILVKNGLADARVERIESYADHRPQVRDNGQAPQNRRIEILLRATNQ